MNERQITEKQIFALGQGLRGCVIIKHSDRATSAIPDITVSFHNFTHWIEMKYLRKDDELKDIIKTNQLLLGHQLSEQTGDRCWTVVYEDAREYDIPKRITIWKPAALFGHLYPGVAGPIVDGFKTIGRTPGHVHDGNFYGALSIHGAIYRDGWDLNFLVNLIKERT